MTDKPSDSTNAKPRGAKPIPCATVPCGVFGPCRNHAKPLGNKERVE